jgi:hypothetical protein
MIPTTMEAAEASPIDRWSFELLASVVWRSSGIGKGKSRARFYHACALANPPPRSAIPPAARAGYPLAQQADPIPHRMAFNEMQHQPFNYLRHSRSNPELTPASFVAEKSL